jgi:hypothetical protein
MQKIARPMIIRMRFLLPGVVKSDFQPTFAVTAKTVRKP